MSHLIFAAPLQGYTSPEWRNLHNEIFGGIDSYYTPFIRLEKGLFRNKDIRDVEPSRNKVSHLTPQIIASTPEQIITISTRLHEMGYNEIDVNMGCPFPLQVRKHCGAGILQHPEMVKSIINAMSSVKGVQYSIKMRLGQESVDEWREIMPHINSISLKRVIIHPRIGRQQYNGEINEHQFAEIAQSCKHPLVFNGDVTTTKRYNEIITRYPMLEGVMIGRGLLANPALALECSTGKNISQGELTDKILTMHDRLLSLLTARLHGDSQILSHVKPYWEYLLPQLDKRIRKKILKSNTLSKYCTAVSSIRNIT